MSVCFWCFVFFFFQAEDGIRDKLVTGVQTCALPISRSGPPAATAAEPGSGAVAAGGPLRGVAAHARRVDRRPRAAPQGESEERRVGKECRSRWSPDH